MKYSCFGVFLKHESIPDLILKFSFGHEYYTDRGIYIVYVNDGGALIAADINFIPYMIKEASIDVDIPEKPSAFNAKSFYKD